MSCIRQQLHPLRSPLSNVENTIQHFKWAVCKCVTENTSLPGQAWCGNIGYLSLSPLGGRQFGSLIIVRVSLQLFDHPPIFYSRFVLCRVTEEAGAYPSYFKTKKPGQFAKQTIQRSVNLTGIHTSWLLHHILVKMLKILLILFREIEVPQKPKTDLELMALVSERNPSVWKKPLTQLRAGFSQPYKLTINKEAPGRGQVCENTNC